MLLYDFYKDIIERGLVNAVILNSQPFFIAFKRREQCPKAMFLRQNISGHLFLLLTQRLIRFWRNRSQVCLHGEPHLTVVRLHIGASGWESICNLPQHHVDLLKSRALRFLH